MAEARFKKYAKETRRIKNQFVSNIVSKLDLELDR